LQDQRRQHDEGRHDRRRDARDPAVPANAAGSIHCAHRQAGRDVDLLGVLG
jgi:hypothetical protein